MSKGIIQTVAGGIVTFMGVASVLAGMPVLGEFLISAGVGLVMSGVGTMLSKGPLQGVATATRNPIAPFNIVYGRKRVGGTVIYINSFGDSDKWLDMVMVLAAHPCQSVDELLFDQQRIMIGAHNTSFTPLQQTLNIRDIRRSENVITVTLLNDIPLLADGDQVIIDHNNNGAILDSYRWTGKFPVTIIGRNIPNWPNIGGATAALVFTYLCGGDGNPSHLGPVDNEGQCVTTWANYGAKVYVETLGDPGGPFNLLGHQQALGETFVGMLNGTPEDGDPGNLALTPGGSTVNPWTANCSLVGKTAVWLRLHYNDAIFANGLPQISFLIHGKDDIYDPRLGAHGSPGTTGYTENAALCIADYLNCGDPSRTQQDWGFKAPYGTEIPLPSLIAAANICDEQVALAEPMGVTEPRYTLNGGFDLTMKRGEVLRNMLTSCGGRLTYVGGQFVIWPAAWYGVSGIIGAGGNPSSSTEIYSLATGPIQWRPTVSISELYNGVKGTYISPVNKWMSSDFPPYVQDAIHGYNNGSPAYDYDQNLTEDGGDRRWLDIQLPFTISCPMAQRLAKIELLRRRFQGTGTLLLNMAGYQFTPMDIVALDLPYFGWSAKSLEVLDARLRFDKQTTGPGNEAILLGTEIDVQETDSSIYFWDIGEELSPAGYQQAIVPDTRTPAPPMNVVLSSANNSILVSWTAPDDAYVINGGHIEVEYQLVVIPEGLWISLAKMDPTVTQAVIKNLVAGASYNVQIRSVNAAGIPSVWVTAAPETVIATLTLTSSAVYGVVGASFTGALMASGGFPPYSYSIIGGTGLLPPGVTLDSSTGIFSGSPSLSGTFTFTAEVEDSSSAIATCFVSILITVTGIVPGPPALASGALAEIGPRYLDADNQTRTQLQMTASLPGSQDHINIWYSQGTFVGGLSVPSGASTQLTAGISAGATSLPLASGTDVVADGARYALIDNELFELISTGGTPTVRPGALGTTQASHSINAPVTIIALAFLGTKATSASSLTWTVAGPDGQGWLIFGQVFRFVISTGNAAGDNWSELGGIASNQITLAYSVAGTNIVHDAAIIAFTKDPTTSSFSAVFTALINPVPGYNGIAMVVSHANAGDTAIDSVYGRQLQGIETPIAVIGQMAVFSVTGWGIPAAGDPFPMDRLEFVVFNGDPTLGNWLTYYASAPIQECCNNGGGANTAFHILLDPNNPPAVPAVNRAMAILGQSLQNSANVLDVKVPGTASGLNIGVSGLTAALGNGLTFSGNNVIANLGNGLQFSGPAVQVNLGNGLVFSAGSVQANLGNGLTFSGTAVQLNLGGGLSFTGSSVQVSAGSGLVLSGGNLNVNLGTNSGLSLSGSVLSVQTGNGIQVTSGSVTVNLGNGLTLSGSAMEVNATNGLNFTGSQLQVNTGAGISIISLQLAIPTNGVTTAMINSLDVSKLNAGTMTVGSGGITFSGSGGVTINLGNLTIGTGNISTTIGSIQSTSFQCLSGGNGPSLTPSAYDTTGGTAVYKIQGTTICDASMNGFFKSLTINGALAISSAGTVTIPSGQAITINGRLQFPNGGTGYQPGSVGVPANFSGYIPFYDTSGAFIGHIGYY